MIQEGRESSIIVELSEAGKTGIGSGIETIFCLEG